MLDAKCYDFCNEFYVVEKSVEVVVKIGGEDRRIRIDALHHVRESTIRYSTRAYIEEAITVQPTYPPKGIGGFERKPESVQVWVCYDLTADGAIDQALSVLEDRCRSSAKA